MDALSDPARLVARLMLAFIFVVDGWGKIAQYGAVADYMQNYGVSGRLLPLVILAELGGGILVALGLLTRIAATGLAGFCLLTALFFHADFGDPNQVIQAYKNIAMAGGFIMLAAAGPGAWSLDRIRKRLGAKG